MSHIMSVLVDKPTSWQLWLGRLALGIKSQCRLCVNGEVLLSHEVGALMQRIKGKPPYHFLMYLLKVLANQARMDEADLSKEMTAGKLVNLGMDRQDALTLVQQMPTLETRPSRPKLVLQGTLGIALTLVCFMACVAPRAFLGWVALSIIPVAAGTIGIKLLFRVVCRVIYGGLSLSPTRLLAAWREDRAQAATVARLPYGVDSADSAFTTSDTQFQLNHTYTSLGTHTVTVEVEDGGSDVDIEQFDIAPSSGRSPDS